MARERNAKKMGKSDEERKAASQKAKQDAAAKMCELCRQTFMVNARPPLLYQHIVAKHPDKLNALEECFPVELKGWDPNDPKGEKAAAAAKAAKKPSKKKGGAGGADLDALLDAGLSKGKKKK